ncbi:MAG: alpha/beta hydrolase [Acidobacteria bacterium]|nr:alpha/beta hydrolase [Acidobacteriota bacterium]MBI3423560.1 alpha/beta hydrolase [Acidobacteriota bacterium]
MTYFLVKAGCRMTLLGMLCCLSLSTLTTAQPPAQKAAKASVLSGVRSEEIKFDSAGVALAGTLLLPETEAGKRAPVVLLLSSYGETTRDGFKFGNVAQPVYRELAEHLAGQGFGVLRYDKRCAGASGCKPKMLFDDLVDDAREAVTYLRKRPEFEPTKVFIFGHGEGGFIGSVLGTNDDKLAGIILAASPGRTWNKLLRDQFQQQLKEAGKPAAEIAAFIAKFDGLVRLMGSAGGEELSKGFDPQQPQEAAVLKLVGHPEFAIPLFINDPLQVANGVKAPLLILQGGKDLMVSVKDAQFLNEAMTRAHHRDTTLQLFPDVDHLLKTNQGSATSAANSDAARPLDAALLTTLTQWLQKRAQ